MQPEAMLLKLNQEHREEDEGVITGDAMEILDLTDFNRSEELRNNPALVLPYFQRIATQDVQCWHSEEFGRDPIKVDRKYIHPVNDAPTICIETKHKPQPRPLYPVAVVELLKAEITSGFGGGATIIIARLRCDNGATEIAMYSESWFSGTRMEPPDHDAYLTWGDSPEIQKQLAWEYSSER